MKKLQHEVSYLAIDTRANGVHSRSQEIVASRMAVVSVSGVLQDAYRSWYLNHSDQLPAESSVTEIIDSSGEWSALAVSKEGDSYQYLYFGDPSGFSPIFYSLVSGSGLVVSSSFSGVVQGVRRLGGKLKLNTENYLTLVSGKSATFSNLIANETMAREIRVLGHNEAIYVTDDEVRLVSRGSMSNVESVDDYEHALTAGIESAASTIQRFTSENLDHERLITLTGGVDSRIVLGILKVSGLLDDFKVWTMDPRQTTSLQQQKVLTADVEIADELRRHYGLEWMEPRYREKIALSYDEALANYQSFNSNFAYTFAPANHVSLDEQPLLTLRGGGGEIIRGSGNARLLSNRYYDYLNQGGTLDEDKWAARSYLSQSVATEKTKQVAETFLSEQLRSAPSGSLRSKIDSYYRSTRNRGHFGHVRQSASLGDRLMQVLTNPLIQRAAELSSYESTVAGEVVIDLFDRTDPSLRRFPFENVDSTDLFMTTKPEAFAFTDRFSWEQPFDERKKNTPRPGFRTLWGPGERGEESHFEPRVESLRYLSRGFETLLDFVELDQRANMNIQQSMVLKGVQDGTIAHGITSAKVASALDVFMPMPLSSPGMHYYTSPKRADKLAPYNSLRSSAMPYRLS